MKRIIFLIIISFSFLSSQTRREFVAMILPNPKAPSNAEPTESYLNQDAYEEIASQLIKQEISVVEKSYVDNALKEMRDNKDIDFEAASIRYAKDNKANRVIWYYIIDKSGGYEDKHYWCTVSLINVETAELLYVESKEGIDRGDKEKAVRNAAKQAISSVLKFIDIGSSELITLTLKGKLDVSNLKSISDILAGIRGVKSVYERFVDQTRNEYAFTLKSSEPLKDVRDQILLTFEKNDFTVDLLEQTINKLSFSIQASSDRCKVSFSGTLPTEEMNKIYTILSSLKNVKKVFELQLTAKYTEYKIFYDGNLPVLRNAMFDEFKSNELELTLLSSKENALDFKVQKIVTPISTTPLYISGGLALASIGVGAYAYLQAKDTYDNYSSATMSTDAKKYKDDTKKYDDLTAYSAISAGATAAFFVVYEILYHNSGKPDVSAALYFPNKNSAGVTLRIGF